MEETGCDQVSAELTLKDCDYNLEKALQIISSVFQNIVVIKGKFIFTRSFLFGVFIVIFQLRQKQIYRIRTIVSYDPRVYEINLSLDWYLFEQQICAFRLNEGSLSGFTQELDNLFYGRLNNSKEFKEVLLDPANGDLETILRAVLTEQLPSEDVLLTINRDLLNLAQFRRLALVPTEEKDYGQGSALNTTISLNLKIELVHDYVGGLPAKSLEVGDLVLVKVTDERDIAHYLSHLIGGGQGEKVLPLTVPIEEIHRRSNEIEILTRFGPGVTGATLIGSQTRVKVWKKKKDSSFFGFLWPRRR